MPHALTPRALMQPLHSTTSSSDSAPRSGLQRESVVTHSVILPNAECQLPSLVHFGTTLTKRDVFAS